MTDRYESLDAIRGVAVMGILAMNIVAFAMPMSAYFNPAAGGAPGGADLAAWAFNFVFIDSKMRGLFSMLFGASTLLVILAASGITVLAYSPMAQGILAGRFGPRPEFAKGDHRKGHRLFQPDIYPRVQAALERLQPIADRNRVSLGQLALAWVIARPGVCAIAGARNAEQAAGNARAATLVLAAADRDEMDAIGRTVTDALDDNPVQWNF